jgi:hypothetical protein
MAIMDVEPKTRAWVSRIGKRIKRLEPDSKVTHDFVVRRALACLEKNLESKGVI